jgi:hypothetical protein
MRTFLVLLASLFLIVSAVFSQNSRGTITGTVTDSAGALMPGIRVEAKNVDTDALSQVASNSTGTYTIAQLPPGTYQISVSLPGFRPYTRTGVKVLESQIMRIDIIMIMLSADEILTNDSVIQLIKVGIEEDLIISKIRESQHTFDLSVQGMVALKEGGVSDRLMRFLMDTTKIPEAKLTPAAVHPAVVTEAPIVSKESSKPADVPVPKTDPGYPTEIGIYVKAAKQWIEIQPEVVIWQTGGTLKRFATAGIVQGDVNGRIKGVHSDNALKTPVEFLIVAPEGVTLEEYQLIHLRELRDAREFRTVTGGIFSSSGGATRDSIQFSGTKVISRTFSVTLPVLDPGEYGFLPTGATPPGSSANVGKMYTFQVIQGSRN